MKKGFTLAEILIVLAVIGILTSVLLPVAFNSAPDENVLKFKKATNDFDGAIRELIHSDKYFLNGDFGTKPNGELVRNKSYFCRAFADIISAKTVKCMEAYNTTNTDTTSCDTNFYSDTSDISTFKEYLDTACINVVQNFKSANTSTASNAPGVELVNGVQIVFSQPSFGALDSEGGSRVYANPNSYDIPLCHDENNNDAAYVIACIDVDGDGVETPFGFGIRADGRILHGKKADDWENKSLKKEG